MGKEHKAASTAEKQCEDYQHAGTHTVTATIASFGAFTAIHIVLPAEPSCHTGGLQRSEAPGGFQPESVVLVASPHNPQGLIRIDERGATAHIELDDILATPLGTVVREALASSGYAH